MDARTLFLILHRHSHGDDQPTALAAQILAIAPDHMRIVPPGHNSIAWLIWHVARGEDWGVTSGQVAAWQLETTQNANVRVRFPNDPAPPSARVETPRPRC